MAGIRAAKEEYLAEHAGTTTFLSNAELIEKETEFCVIAREVKPTVKYGDCWHLSIVYLDELGQHVEQTVFLSLNDYREWFFNTKLAGVAMLHSIKLINGINKKTGRQFIDIDDADGIEPCPCHTGDFQKGKKSNGRKISEEVHAEEQLDFEGKPVSESLSNVRAFVWNKVQLTGWPVEKQVIDKMSMEQLDELKKKLDKFKG